MLSSGFCVGAVLRCEEILGRPGEESRVGRAGCGGVILGGDVKGEGEEGREVGLNV